MKLLTFSINTLYFCLLVVRYCFLFALYSLRWNELVQHFLWKCESLPLSKLLFWKIPPKHSLDMGSMTHVTQQVLWLISKFPAIWNTQFTLTCLVHNDYSIIVLHWIFVADVSFPQGPELLLFVLYYSVFSSILPLELL